jgi:AraC-like DNA-binding protein
VISFGPRSILLAIGTLHGFVLAALLVRVQVNRTANRLLALLVAIVALRILPYIIGFAGFYDAYPWLSFLPYDFSLGYGAVIWLYVSVLCTGQLPNGWRWHLAPAAVQGAYYAVLFIQPLAVKHRWDSAVHAPLVMRLESAWALTALAVYLMLSWRAHSRYQAWLDSDQSNREEFRLTWLRLFLIVIGVTLVLWAGTVLYDVFVTPLDYFDRFGLYLWFSLLVYGLGGGGLRSARLAYPRPTRAVWPGSAPPVETDAPAEFGSDRSPPGQQAADRVATSAETAEPPPVDRQQDWERMGREWSERVREEGWWRDKGLTAPILARHLATNTTYLSRALNTGLGHNFNEFVNLLRVEAVQEELATPGQQRDLLTIALDAGFNSKASFNRVFKRLTSETPSDFRRRKGLPAAQDQ